MDELDERRQRKAAIQDERVVATAYGDEGFAVFDLTVDAAKELRDSLIEILEGR